MTKNEQRVIAKVAAAHGVPFDRVLRHPAVDPRGRSEKVITRSRAAVCMLVRELYGATPMASGSCLNYAPRSSADACNLADRLYAGDMGFRDIVSRIYTELKTTR